MIETGDEPTTEDEDSTFGCGWSYDHDTRELECVDGVRTYECRVCGAEWSEEEDSED